MNSLVSNNTKNPFAQPFNYRNLLAKSSLVQYEEKDFRGKSLICIFFTRYCGVGCPFCFFKSAPPPGDLSIEGHFSDEGITRFIQFANQANAGYLLVSGGGEPLNHRNAILRTVKEVNTERIVLVTSGSWAINKKAAQQYLRRICEAMESRTTPSYVTIRVSVSQWHAIKLGTAPAKNLIEIFEEEYAFHPFLKLQIHTFEEDTMLNQVLSHFPDISIEESSEIKPSDDPFVFKRIPKKITLKLSSGFQIIVGISKVFKSGLRPNLNEIESLNDSIKVFERDLIESEDNNSAIVDNANGEKGLDWAINYNGNTCTWQNQVNDNQYNLYEDNFKDIFEGTLQDPLTLSYIEKGRVYRESIVEEVSPRSVLRMKAISLRDYSGTIIFEEEKTRLYYTIRVIQDYLKDGRVNKEALKQLPSELLHLIFLPLEELKKHYHNTKYTIIDQQRKKVFRTQEWRDLFELIKLGHYDLSDEDVQEALWYFNSRSSDEKIDSLSSLKHENGDIERRLTERLMYIKPMKKQEVKPQTILN